MREKGIETAIDAIESINRDAGKEVCSLDIFGRIDDGYKDRFNKIMKKAAPAIAYRGTVPYEQSVGAISGYYALLFPTYWDGEGFPGTIVDAFSAGLPVIATDWNCNGEIVKNGKNGLLYPNADIKDLREAIEWMIEGENMQKLKRNCIESAKKYQPDKYIKRIIDCVEKQKCR